MGNDGINFIDVLGLEGSSNDEDCCKGQKGVKEITDDAGVKCCENELEYIELNAEIDGQGGHAWLGTLTWQVGFHPTVGPNFFEGTREWLSKNPKKRQGKLKNDKGKESSAMVLFNACPESVKKLKENMEENGKNDWVLNNSTGRNCMGWACERLRDVGFDPGFDPNKNKLKPYDILDHPNVLVLEGFNIPKSPQL